MHLILYIGQYTEGTTSKMRADILASLLPDNKMEIINTHKPFFSTHKLWRSIGFRYKKGPLIKKVNAFVKSNLNAPMYEMIWVDKGVFITQDTLSLLRSKTKKLIHFTPDPAFFFHTSKHFTKGIHLYDYLITTKLFEVKDYEKLVPKEKVILSTQGYDKSVHKPYHIFSEKKDGVVFIGHFEKERGESVLSLINNDISVSVAGNHWQSFCQKHSTNSRLTYLGNNLYGASYSEAISSFQFSIGFLSKWIPETHTTRTFEIPACGTALLSERNFETQSFFDEDEAIFYSTTEELIKKIRYYHNNIDSLELLSEKGREKVINSGFDYKSILTEILKTITII